ncbi:MAG: acyl-CoA thioesterase [Cyanobium sp.]
MDLLSTHPIKTSDLGFHGNLFGGNVLAWMDASAVSYAMRLSGEPRMLTLSLEDCHFKQTVKEGELLSLYGSPCHLGRSSLRIAVEARLLNLHTQQECTVLCACFRFVCVNSEGKSTPIGNEGRQRIAAMIQGQHCAAAARLAARAVAAAEEGVNGWGI